MVGVCSAMKFSVLRVTVFLPLPSVRFGLQLLAVGAIFAEGTLALDKLSKRTFISIITSRIGSIFVALQKKRMYSRF